MTTTYLTVPQLADKLKCSVPSAYKIVRKMPIGVKVKIGSRVRVIDEQVDSWLSEAARK